MRESSTVWILGARGVGKKALAKALGVKGTGENTSPATKHVWVLAPASAPVAVRLSSNYNLVSDSLADNDVLILVFDISNKESFTSGMLHWTKVTRRQGVRVLLVGNKMDLSSDREVSAAEAMEVALVEFDEYAEVCSIHRPFEGVSYVRQLLASWMTQCPVEESTQSEDTRSSDSTKHCIRTSIWLYDPTEEAYSPTEPSDVRLRPISRALFEMRQAGSSKTAAEGRKREHSMSKLVSRSRYYGPTESSRHMRWQSRQRQNELRRRSASTPDFHTAHAELENKSFMQPTKLMQQRFAQLKQHVASLQQPKAPVKRTTMSPRKDYDTSPKRVVNQCVISKHPESAKILHSRRVRSPQRQHMTEEIASLERVTFELSLRSPGAEQVAILPAPVPLAHLQSPVPPVTSPTMSTWTPAFDSIPAPMEEQVDVSTPVTACLGEDFIEEDGQDTEESDTDPFGAQSSEIDEMLDYFDGITLPI